MDPPANSVQEHLGGRTHGLEERIRILESALESMGDGVAVVDEYGKFLLINSAARRIYGRDSLDESVERWAETYGIFLPDRVTPFPPHDLPLARALRGESTDQVELFFRNAAHPDGIFVASTGRHSCSDANRPPSVQSSPISLRSNVSAHPRPLMIARRPPGAAHVGPRYASVTGKPRDPRNTVAISTRSGFRRYTIRNFPETTSRNSTDWRSGTMRPESGYCRSRSTEATRRRTVRSAQAGESVAM